MKNKSEISEQTSPSKAPHFLKSLLLRSVSAEADIQGRRKILIILGAFILIIFATLPFYVDVDASFVGYYLFIVFVYIIMAQGWNLVAGYAGQISMAGNSFFRFRSLHYRFIWLKDITHTGYYFDPLVMTWQVCSHCPCHYYWHTPPIPASRRLLRLRYPGSRPDPYCFSLKAQRCNRRS